MHPYAIDSDERKVIPFFIAAESILLTWFLYSILGAIQISLPWWFEAPSVMGFYGLLYSIFDDWLWRKSIFRYIKLVKTPDFNGRWKGCIRSSFDDYNTKINANIEIFQHWTQLSVILKTDSSESQSSTAAIITANQDIPVLCYEYSNEPKINAIKTMHAHRGTARLKLTSNQVFEGEYYTGRDRGEFGLLYFERS